VRLLADYREDDQLDYLTVAVGCIILLMAMGLMFPILKEGRQHNYEPLPA
jgi:hypothetical protein